jgi:hypothetical protein
MPIALASWSAVDRNYRRLALSLIETLRQQHEERGIAFAIGVCSADRTSVAYRFWTSYARTFPQNFRFLFPLGFWINARHTKVNWYFTTPRRNVSTSSTCTFQSV